MATAEYRVLYIGNNIGYVITHRLPILQALLRAGYDVHIAAPAYMDSQQSTITPNAVEQLKQMGFTFHDLNMRRNSISFLAELRTFAQITRIYQNLKPDLVYHVTIKPVIYGGLAGRIVGIPAVIFGITGLGYIFSSMDLKARMLRVFTCIAYKLVFAHPNAAILFQNPDDRERLLSLGIVKEKNTSIIKGSGVDLEVYSFNPEPCGQLSVLLVSRMLWTKGIGEFVESARQLRSEGIKARFILAGDTDSGNPEAIPPSQLESWNGSGDVEWFGWVRNIPELLQNCQIVCLPSYYGEGIPKSLIEAAAAGRPIVTTDMPGCREVVKDNENGYLVKPRSISSLTEALRKLLQDSRLRQEMGRRSRELAEAEFSADHIVSQTLKICEGLLQAAQNRN